MRTSVSLSTYRGIFREWCVTYQLTTQCLRLAQRLSGCRRRVGGELSEIGGRRKVRSRDVAFAGRQAHQGQRVFAGRRRRIGFGHYLPRHCGSAGAGGGGALVEMWPLLQAEADPRPAVARLPTRTSTPMCAWWKTDSRRTPGTTGLNSPCRRSASAAPSPSKAIRSLPTIGGEMPPEWLRRSSICSRGSLQCDRGL